MARAARGAFLFCPAFSWKHEGIYLSFGCAREALLTSQQSILLWSFLFRPRSVCAVRLFPFSCHARGTARLHNPQRTNKQERKRTTTPTYLPTERKLPYRYLPERGKNPRNKTSGKEGRVPRKGLVKTVIRISHQSPECDETRRCPARWRVSWDARQV